jgi:dTDP-4-amino-4,6-dideoxygalactose transaminase
VDALEALARQHNLPLVFDAAHAFSNHLGARRIGGFGDAEVFSFHATKFLNTFEGGVITTNDDSLAQELRSMRNFGFSGYDQVSALGTNGKMSEISAAMGLCMLDEIDVLLDINRCNYEAYHKVLDQNEYLELLRLDDPEAQNCQYVVGSVSAELPAFSRDLLVDVLWKENALVRKYFHPGVHRAEPYGSQQPDRSLPETDDLCNRVLVLPTGTAVSREDIEKLADCVQFVLENTDEIKTRLEQHG